ncbi:MAG: rod shape determining protein RodA [Chloroflexota bacterium]|nr:rod shape determining protein RodA [Chloroflexota bacterium]
MAAPELRWRQFDFLQALGALVLTAFGVLLVTSATWQYFDHPTLLGNTWFLKQALAASVGWILMIALSCVHPRMIKALAFPIYGASLAALGVVLVVGRGAEDYGAQRWIEVGGFQLQPSEPAKLALVIILARVLSGGVPGLRALLLSGLVLGGQVFLIYLQPDLGTALSFLGVWVGMIVLAGTPRRYLAAIGALFVLAAPIVWLTLHDYMRQRLLIFLNPSADALGQGYNILQAQISIGSGGMWGKGLLEGTQTQLRYLRVSQSDFIFSVLGEELGFVGAIVLFAVVIILLFRVLHAYEVSNDRFHALLCAGVASMIAFQAIANVGSNVGLTPVVGIPLPLVSYGGSALLTQLAALGLVQGGLLRKRRYRFEA